MKLKIGGTVFGDEIADAVYDANEKAKGGEAGAAKLDKAVAKALTKAFGKDDGGGNYDFVVTVDTDTGEVVVGRRPRVRAKKAAAAK